MAKAKAKAKAKKAKPSGAGVFMNPKTDFGFKKIFGHKRLLIIALNALGALPEKIIDITYLSLEQLGVAKETGKLSTIFREPLKTPNSALCSFGKMLIYFSKLRFFLSRKP